MAWQAVGNKAGGNRGAGGIGCISRDDQQGSIPSNLLSTRWRRVCIEPITTQVYFAEFYSRESKLAWWAAEQSRKPRKRGWSPRSPPPWYLLPRH